MKAGLFSLSKTANLFFIIPLFIEIDNGDDDVAAGTGGLLPQNQRLIVRVFRYFYVNEKYRKTQTIEHVDSEGVVIKVLENLNDRAC
jgi:hypothetical protein